MSHASLNWLDPLASSFALAPRFETEPAWLVQRPGGLFGGVFVAPAASVLGLKAWEDAYEGLYRERPWVIFELEKILRMMFAGSSLALEILGSAQLLVAQDPHYGRRLVEWSLTPKSLDHAWTLASRRLAGAPDQAQALCQMLTGALLAKERALSFELPTLIDRLFPGKQSELAEPSPTLLDEVCTATIGWIESARTRWSPRPANYDDAHEFLVASRLKAPGFCPRLT